MVDDATDVAYAARPDILEAAKNKIVILRAVVLRTIPSDPGDERRLDHQQPRKVVLTDQQVPIEVGLEVWRVKEAAAGIIHAQSVFIGVEKLVTARLQRGQHAEQGVV